MSFSRAGGTRSLSPKQAQALLAFKRREAVPEKQPARAPLPKITLGGPPDRAARLLAGAERHLADCTRRLDEALAMQAKGKDPARLATDPVYGDLRNARTFLPMAHKAALAAKAALIGHEPEYLGAEKGVRDLGAWLSRAGYLVRQANRLAGPNSPLRSALVRIDQASAAGRRDADGALLEVQRAATRAHGKHAPGEDNAASQAAAF